LYLYEIEEGQRVFIDANIFVYHFSQGSRFNKSCTDFLSRVEKTEIHGVTSTAIIQEATHRLMMCEASSVISPSHQPTWISNVLTGSSYTFPLLLMSCRKNPSPTSEISPDLLRKLLQPIPLFVTTLKIKAIK